MARTIDDGLLQQLGARVQQARKDRGFTQERLAEAVGVQPETLSRVETGAKAPSLALLLDVARALEVKPAALLDVDAALPAPTLDPKEAEILAVYRALPPRDQELVMSLALQMERRQAPK